VAVVQACLADLVAEHPMAHLQPAQELLAKEIMAELEAIIQTMVPAEAAVQEQPAKVIKIPKAVMEE
jgi:hypothetical protein